MTLEIQSLEAEVASLSPVFDIGRVSAVEGNLIRVSGLAHCATVGDRAQVRHGAEVPLEAEVVQLHREEISLLSDAVPEGVAIGDMVRLRQAAGIAPSPAWIGRIVDCDGAPLDGRPLLRGVDVWPLKSPPPPASQRRGMGGRIETGLSVFNTMLPLVRGQRIGLFAGSGVGKSNLLGRLACGVAADVVVLALVGERGREVRDFVEDVVGVEGMARTVAVAATSDQSPAQRRRSLWTALTTAEFFRDQGKHVLLLVDSITRFAEAHREVAVISGELPALRGYPASTAHAITSACERAGPGTEGQGDITAVFSVLVAGSDMNEPIADILRGVLDGHVILDRDIAERGRFPAVDIARSVSRSLPRAATAAQNEIILQVRGLIRLYEKSELMLRAGLYSEGADAALDQAIRVWPELEAFWASESVSIDDAFARLHLILKRSGLASGVSEATAVPDV